MKVRGSLFGGYVKVVRDLGGIDWSPHLLPEDIRYLSRTIENDHYYPLDAFERLTNAILAEITKGSFAEMREWGRVQADDLHTRRPKLVIDNVPADSFLRFRTMRATLFDFETLDTPTLTPTSATMGVHHHMAVKAEEAAAHQALGFFARVIEISGGTDVKSEITSRTWTGDATTLLTFSWQLPALD